MGCGPSSDTSSHAPSAPGAAPKLPKFSTIADKFETYVTLIEPEELQQALRKAGLESSNLVVAIDYTESNVRSGAKSFGGKCLHHIDPSGFVVNPYQSVIHIMGRTLEAFDDDKLIPTLGFGDVRTGCASFFNLGVNSAPCRGLTEALDRYKHVTPSVELSGPTNFAPVIRETIRIVQQSRRYHILVIIADGQVTLVNETRDAIVAASSYPISIVMVGVGDGPWDMMKKFDDALPKRRFDNFQFVEYNKVLLLNPRAPEVGFATAALMEIPDQYNTIKKLGLV